MKSAAISILLMALALSRGHADSGPVAPADEVADLPVVVTETAETVRLRILVPEEVDPGSVEVQLAGREVVVVARRTSGISIRSKTLRLAEAAVEQGATADYEPDGSLTITLQKVRPRAVE